MFNFDFCVHFLFFRMIKNNGSVLFAHIRSLSVELCWIMGGEEYIQQRFVIDLIRIEDDLNGFSMISLTIRYFAVVSVRGVSTGIARNCFVYSIYLLKRSFNTPKTTSCKRGSIYLAALWHLTDAC